MLPAELHEWIFTLSEPLSPQPREIFQQQPVDEAIAPADLLEEDTVNGVVEEASIIGRGVSLNEEDKVQCIVLDHVETAVP